MPIPDPHDPLRRQADILRQAAGHLERASDLMRRVRPELFGVHAAMDEIEDLPLPASRRGQLRRTLLHHGPLTRKQLHQLSGVPLGTIAGLLNHENGFRSGDDGRWSLVDDQVSPSTGTGENEQPAES